MCNIFIVQSYRLTNYQFENLDILVSLFVPILIGALATAIIYICSDLFRIFGSIHYFIFYREAAAPILLLPFCIIGFLLNQKTIHYFFYLTVFSLCVVALLSAVHISCLINSRKIGRGVPTTKLFSNRDLFFFWLSSEILGIIWIIRDKFSLLAITELMSLTDVAVLFLIRLMTPLSMIKSSFNSNFSNSGASP